MANKDKSGLATLAANVIIQRFSTLLPLKSSGDIPRDVLKAVATAYFGEKAERFSPGMITNFSALKDSIVFDDDFYKELGDAVYAVLRSMNYTSDSKDDNNGKSLGN